VKGKPMTGSVSHAKLVTVQEVVGQMERRLGELLVLRASPDMYGSESLDGQVAELELWLARFDRLGAVDAPAV
jgi:hypothetical protein